MGLVMRNWLKKIMMECLKESIKQQPMILSSRAPRSEDIYEIGTVWLNKKDKYIAKKVHVYWVKYE